MVPSLTDSTEKEGYTGLIFCANSWTHNTTTNSADFTPPNNVQADIGTYNVIAFALQSTGDALVNPIPTDVYLGNTIDLEGTVNLTKQISVNNKTVLIDTSSVSWASNDWDL